MEYITHKCKCCGWEKKLPASWASDKPRYCGNHSCVYSGRVKREFQSFVKTPAMLETIMPIKHKPKVSKHSPKTPEVPLTHKESDFKEVSKERYTRKRKNRGG
jgi:hypothetical protein